jgi:hypothetical protein
VKLRSAISVVTVVLSAGLLLSAQDKAVVQMDSKPAPFKAGGSVGFTFTLNEPLPKGAHFDFRISPVAADEEISLGSGRPSMRRESAFEYPERCRRGPFPANGTSR